MVQEEASFVIGFELQTEFAVMKKKSKTNILNNEAVPCISTEQGKRFCFCIDCR